MILKIDANFEEKPICCFKNDKNSMKFDPSNQKTPRFPLWLFPLCKVYNLSPKKVQSSYLHDTEKSCKIWRKTGFFFEEWHEKFGKFSPEHLNTSKTCILMRCFRPKYKMFELKKYRRVIFDGTEYLCKIWRKTKLCFQKWHKEFGRFSPKHVWKSKNLNFYWVLLSKVEVIYEPKTYIGVMCHDNEEWWKIWTRIDWSV